MRRTLALGLVFAAMLGGTAAARAGDFHISFGIGVGHGGRYFYRPYGFSRPYYAFRPYYGFRPYYAYSPYRYPYFAGPGYSLYRAYPYRPYYYPPRVMRYYVPPRVYAPPYGAGRGRDVRYYAPERGYSDYTPRRYRRPW